LVGALAFLRVGGILFALPVFGDAPTPVRARILAALAITIGIYPLLPPEWAPHLGADVVMVFVYILKELLIGLAVGFFGRVAFDGVMMAASVVSYQMGFGTANLFLPDYGERLDGFSAFHRMLVLLIFLALGLHQIFFAAIIDTFRLIPGGAAHLDGALGVLMLQLTAGMLGIAIQLAAPIIVALLFTMAALGLIARTVPNMNAFIMSFPASFCVGLVVYIATLPFFPTWMSEHFGAMHEQIFGAIRALAGRT
jgi:flagellar biosynthetic protein FliR